MTRFIADTSTRLGLALVGIAALIAIVLARPERVPAQLAPPPRSAAASAPFTSDHEPAVDPATEVEAPEAPAAGYALTRQDFETVLTKVRSRALACKDEVTPAVVPLKITIAPSGAVGSVVLPDELRGTHAGDCIVRAMRSASFPAYKAPPVPAVEWRYTLRFSGTD